MTSAAATLDFGSPSNVRCTLWVLKELTAIAGWMSLNLIFSDRMHTPEDIRSGLSSLRNIIARRGAILAAHDWSPKNERFLREAIRIRDSVHFDALFVAQLLPGELSS